MSPAPISRLPFLATLAVVLIALAVYIAYGMYQARQIASTPAPAVIEVTEQTLTDEEIRQQVFAALEAEVDRSITSDQVQQILEEIDTEVAPLEEQDKLEILESLNEPLILVE